MFAPTDADFTRSSQQSFQQYRLEESRNSLYTAVNSDGYLQDYETLVLKVNPPTVKIDNGKGNQTLITVESANRPGTLVEVSLSLI